MNTQARVLSALWFLALVNYLDRVTISFAGPSIMKTLGMSPAQFGIILSSFGLGYLLAQLPGGLLSDRWGAKTMLVVGPILWAVFTGATGLVSTLMGFVIVRTCLGLSEGLSATSNYKALGENFPPEKRARALAISSTAIPLAPALAGPIIGKLIGAYGWHTMFVIMLAPSLVAALICYLLIPAKPSLAPESANLEGVVEIPFGTLLKRRNLWLLSFAGFAWNIPYWGFLGWMPSYLVLARHIDIKALGPVAAVPYLFAFLGTLVGGILGSTRLHNRTQQLVVTFFAGAAVSFFLAYQATSAAWAVGGLSGAAFFLFGAAGPVGKFVLDLAPARARAAYIGVYSTVGQLAAVLAPAVIGFMVSATGTFASGFAFMIGGLVVGSGLLLTIRRPAVSRPLTA